MENQDLLGQIEYEEVLFDNMSKLIINRNFIKENQDFWNNLVFKLFEEYRFGIEQTSIRKQAKLLEIILGSMFRHHPSTYLPEDSFDLEI